MSILQRRLVRVAAAAVAVVALGAVPGQAHGGLVGDLITGTGTQLFPIAPHPLFDSVIVRDGPEFEGITDNLLFDFFDDGKLDVTAVRSVGWCCFGRYEFTNFDFTEGDIIGLELVFAPSNFTGDYLTDFTFTANSISINFDEGSVARTQKFTYQISVVPLPAALPLFLSALAGLGLMGWRRRQAGA